MILEDFFTLTEMKNGLTTPARVEELICVMQKQKGCATSNVADSARQWLIVSSTLACTENKECLNHFVFLNGLWFLNQWLQEAVKCGEEVTDSEELINALLGSLEKLPIDRENLRASGILVTVEKLFGHKIVKIKERAQILSERWNNKKIVDYVCQDMKKGCSYINELKPSSDVALVEDKKNAVQEENYRVENENLQTRDSNNLNSDIGDDRLKNSTLNKTDLTSTKNENEEKCAFPSTPSLASKGQDPVEESYVSPVGLISAATPSPEALGKDNDQCDTFFIINDKGCQAAVETTNVDSCKSGRSTSTNILSSSVTSSPAKSPIGLLNASCNLEATEHYVDIGRTKVLKTLEEFNSCEHFTKALQESSNDGSFIRKEAAESSSEIGMLFNEPTVKACKGADKVKFGNTFKSLNFNVNGEINKNSDLELESGEIDALEVARQVAIQVEREVVDYREQSCTSSPEESSKEVVKGSSNSKDDSDTAFSPENVVVADPMTKRQSLESPNKTATVQECSGKTEKSRCDFDLNEDVYSEDHNFAENSFLINHANFSAPIAVPASKGAPGLPIPLLHLDVELGWRGSAATSAFCAASSRRAVNGHETNSDIKRKEKYFEIDLNVTEIEDIVAFDHASAKEVPVSSEIPSGDSSIEVTSERAERINFDLNCVGEVEVPSLHSSILKNHHQKEFLSLFATSSSKQPSMRNFDLNDSPCPYDTVGTQILNISHHSSTHMLKVDDPSISIMGSRMAVERRDHFNQSHQSMENGLNWNMAMAATPLMPYAHQVPPHSHGNNGMFTGSVTPFHPVVYGGGNIPHTINSLEATVVPQIFRSVGVNGSTLSTQPVMMSINTPSSSTGAGSWQPGYNKLEEHAEAATPQATSGNLLKRKEPESGWGPYNIGYKQVTSWH